MTVNLVLRNLSKIKRSVVSPEKFEQRSVSIQADRFRRGRLEHGTRGFLFEMTLRVSRGTEVIPVLSQITLDKVMEERVLLCLEVNTPGFSHHSLEILKEEGNQTHYHQANTTKTDNNTIFPLDDRSWHLLSLRLPSTLYSK